MKAAYKLASSGLLGYFTCTAQTYMLRDSTALSGLDPSPGIKKTPHSLDHEPVSDEGGFSAEVPASQLMKRSSIYQYNSSILDFSTSRSVRKKCLLLQSYSIYVFLFSNSLR